MYSFEGEGCLKKEIVFEMSEPALQTKFTATEITEDNILFETAPDPSQHRIGKRVAGISFVINIGMTRIKTCSHDVKAMILLLDSGLDRL